MVTWIAALAALATPWVAQAQGNANPCDKNHYILRQKCSPADFPDTVMTGIATKTSIGAPLAVAVDAAGNVFFGNDQNAVYRVDPNGVLTLVAQPGGPPPPYDGWWIEWNPNALAAVDDVGNVYYVDAVEYVVRRIAMDGTTVTVAGRNGGSNVAYEDWGMPPTPANEGVVVGARATDLYLHPSAVGIDGAGNLYVASDRLDLDGLVKIAPDGVVTSFTPFDCDGSMPGAVCGASGHIAIDGAGNVYVGDYLCRVHAIAPNGVADIVAGSGYGLVNGSWYGPDDASSCLFRGNGGAAKAAGIGPVSGVALGPDGSLHIADPQFNCIHKVGTDGIISMLAGSCPGPWQFHGVLLAGPMGVAVDAAGNVYIADSGNERVLKLNPDGVMTTIAGLLPAVPQ
jgi:sugar lactone lactonase YvrE